MTVNFRRACVEDIPPILQIFREGQAFLQAQNVPQWRPGTEPTIKEAEAAVQTEQGYVLTVEDTVAAFIMLVPGPDGSPPLSQGEWPGRDEDYVALHRVAVSANMRGMGLCSKLLEAAIEQGIKLGYRAVRIDTHPDNQIMQRAILRVGFQQVGVMELSIPYGTRLVYVYHGSKSV